MVAESPTVLYVTHAGLGTMPSTEALSHIPRIDGATAGDIIPPNDAPGVRAINQNTSGAGAAAKLANLLPSANPALRAMSGGVYVGDGLPPVPGKLAAKIYRG